MNKYINLILQSDGMDLDKNHSDIDNMSNCEHANRKLGSSANEYDTCTTTTISSPEPEEYTYEGAIEGYKSRIISQTNSNMVITVVNNNTKEMSPDKYTNGDGLNKIRTSVSNKIDEKVSSFQRDRVNDFKNNNQKKDLPKVDIHKRREHFERENSQESQPNKSKLPEIANKKSIKDRLFSLEKFTEDNQTQKSTSDLTKLPAEVKPLKERLSSLEKVKSGLVEMDKTKRSNGDLSNTKSLKERLSSLKSQTSEEEGKIIKTEVKEVSMSLKERLSCLDAAKNKEIPKISIEDEHRGDKTKTKERITEEAKLLLNESSLQTDLTGIENQMQSFCRSFDSLNINGETSPSSFERIQSLEDFDCSEIQNNTVASDIETEDSGIHTARDSCAPADDIADLMQVASPVGEPMVEVSEYESSNEDATSALEPKIEEPSLQLTSELIQTVHESIIEEVDEQEFSKAEDTDSASNYIQAMSQPIEESSATEDITEIQIDQDDEDTLKSLDNQDTSVSLNEPVSTTSEGDTVVFEGKMTIHLNLNEICNNANAGAGNNSNSSDSNSTNLPTNRKSMPMVTVSNITTTTNISPKNSIKTLKSCNDHSTLLSKITNLTVITKSTHVTNQISNNANKTEYFNDMKSPVGHDHEISHNTVNNDSKLSNINMIHNDLKLNTTYNTPANDIKSNINYNNSKTDNNNHNNINNDFKSNSNYSNDIKSNFNAINDIKLNNGTTQNNNVITSTQDSNPFWQKRTKHCMEPNRRKTILLINNNTPKTNMSKVENSTENV